MFTTGVKQKVINTDVFTYNTTLDELVVDGVGKIRAANITKLLLQNTVAEVDGVYTYTLSLGSTVTAGDIISYGLDFTTYRASGEYSADRKEGVDPLILQYVASGTTADTMATDLAAAITAMSAKEKVRYHISTATASTTTVIITMTDWYAKPNQLEINGTSGIFIYNNAPAITTQGLEGRGLPKYIEESVKSDTFANRSAYAMEKEFQLDMNATYYQLYVEQASSTEAMVGSVINGGPTVRINKMLLWIKTTLDLDTLNILGAESDVVGNLFGDTVALSTVSNSTTSAVPTSQALRHVGESAYIVALESGRSAYTDIVTLT